MHHHHQPFIIILIFHIFRFSSSSEHFSRRYIFETGMLRRSRGVAGRRPGDSHGPTAVQRSGLAGLTGQAVQMLAGEIELLGVGLVRQDLLASELGGDHFRVDDMPVLPGDVAPHRVVPGEGAVAVGAWYADPLVPLADVGAQVGLVSVSSLAKWAFEFSSCNESPIRFTVTLHCVNTCPGGGLSIPRGVWHLHGDAGQVAGGDPQGGGGIANSRVS